MVTDIMIDTEFLSLKYDAFILSIGAVTWDITQEEFKVEKEFHMFPDLDSQTVYEAKMDKNTFLWWLQQSDEARKAIAEGQKPPYVMNRVEEVLHKLKMFFHDPKTPKRVWSHGATCDLPLLKNWYDKIGMPEPWHYQSPRDTRTLFDAVGFTPKRDYSKSVAHDALADAVAQAKQVHEAWKGRVIYV